jgi:hypothetical protein
MLAIVPGMDRSFLYEQCRRVIGNDPLGTRHIEVLRIFALNASAGEWVVEKGLALAQSVERLRTSADDRIASLLRISRLLQPLNEPEAKIVFNRAIELAGQLDAESVHELAQLGQFVRNGVRALTPERARAMAIDVAVVAADAVIRLDGQDGFPWDEFATALGWLDIPLALAAVARWEDGGLVKRYMLLPGILEAGIASGGLSAVHGVSLFPLLNHASPALLAMIAKAAGPSNPQVIEELAREDLLRFLRKDRETAINALDGVVPSEAEGYWQGHLRATARFLSQEKSASPKDTPLTDEFERKREGFLASLTWTGRFTTSIEIEEFVRAAAASARAKDAFISRPEVLDRMASNVAPRDRVSHIDALVGCGGDGISERDIASAIVARVEQWQASLAVKAWCEERLSDIVVERFSAFCSYFPHESPLQRLLSGSAGSVVTTAVLLKALESQVDTLSSRTVYGLAGVIGAKCLPEEAARTAERFVEMLLARVDASERENFDATDLPKDPAGGVARFLYAYLSDADVRLRWRAAHAVRCLARVGAHDAFEELIKCYGRKDERSFRAVGAPFYWMAARLWLLIAVARLAEEKPGLLNKKFDWLIGVATDPDFPHVLVRHYTRQALESLVSGGLSPSKEKRRIIKQINVGEVPRKKSKGSFQERSRLHAFGDKSQRRFHFDGLDTLRYWYNHAPEAFADLSGDEFLDATETWIVDRWGATGDVWMWEQETRRVRFGDGLETSHSHGEMPTIERYHTHLEWNAMWCTVGELMATRALAKPDAEDDWRCFERWVERWTLSMPPLWLADLRGPKPRGAEHWFGPEGATAQWMEQVADEDYLSAINVAPGEDFLVVSGDWETHANGFLTSTRVATALVSSSTAGALARALQSVASSWDYGLPTADDDRVEIDEGPYQLKGWLWGRNGDTHFDGQDPFRYDVTAINKAPSEEVKELLGLEFSFDKYATWRNSKNGQVVFRYAAWGDTPGDEQARDRRHEPEPRASGWKLTIAAAELQKILDKKGMDLVVEVEITRRNHGYGNDRPHEKDRKETIHDRVLVFRRNGSIEGAEGCLGAWRTSGSRTGARRQQ